MLGNYLITEDTTMKAFKKLMAAALVCVMALTMLTGCAVSDNLVEKALVNKLNAVSAVSYKHKTDLDDEAKKAWDENKECRLQLCDRQEAQRCNQGKQLGR